MCSNKDNKQFLKNAFEQLNRSLDEVAKGFHEIKNTSNDILRTLKSLSGENSKDEVNTIVQNYESVTSSEESKVASVERDRKKLKKCGKIRTNKSKSNAKRCKNVKRKIKHNQLSSMHGSSLRIYTCTAEKFNSSSMRLPANIFQRKKAWKCDDGG